MNGEIDTVLRDIADDLLHNIAAWPTQSPEYAILTQDLSRRPARSRPLLPDNARIGGDLLRRQIYNALCLANESYQITFVVHYLVRWRRPQKMKALHCTDKNAFYELRNRLHSYLEGALHHAA